MNYILFSVSLPTLGLKSVFPNCNMFSVKIVFGREDGAKWLLRNSDLFKNHINIWPKYFTPVNQHI